MCVSIVGFTLNFVEVPVKCYFPWILTSFNAALCRYVRILGAFYLRLTGTDVDVYRYLEPLYNDYRKLRQKLPEGSKILNIFLESAMISFSLMLLTSICYDFQMHL